MGVASDAIRLLTIAVGLADADRVRQRLEPAARARDRAAARARRAVRPRRQPLAPAAAVDCRVARAGAAGRGRRRALAPAGVGLLAGRAAAGLPAPPQRARRPGRAGVLDAAHRRRRSLVFGLLPAWQQASDDVHPMLHDTDARTSASRRTVRLRNVLVVCGDSRLPRPCSSVPACWRAASSARSRRRRASSRPACVTCSSCALPGGPLPDRSLGALLPTARHERARAARRDGGRRRQLTLPWTGYDENTGFRDRRAGRQRDAPNARFHVATPGYFETLRIRLEAGRLFDERDTVRRTHGRHRQRGAGGASTSPARTASAAC